jgi:hypothetical protein
MSTPEDLGALTPVPLMQISTGFWAFKTLAAANELDVFTRLAGGAETTADELARELAIDERPAEMLLTGCASLGLLERGQHGAERAVALLAFHRCRSEPRDRSGRDSPLTRAPTLLTLGVARRSARRTHRSSFENGSAASHRPRDATVTAD